MSSLTGVNAPIMAFDASFSELAVISPDGRVKLFSTNQQRTVTDITQSLRNSPTDTTTEIYSCLAWGPKGKHRRLLFLGTLSGTIKCYDVAKATLLWTNTDAIDGAITALSSNPDSSSASLLVLGTHGHAAIVDRTRGTVQSRWQASKTQVSRSAFVPGKGTVLIAGSSISLFDTSSGTRLCKWPGHSNPIRALQTTADGAYCCTAAEGERSAAVWCIRINPDTGKPLYKASVGQLHAQQPIVDISVISIGKNSNHGFHVAALTQDGSVYVYKCAIDTNGSLTVEHWASSSDSNDQSKVIGIGIQSADNSGSSIDLIVATGNSVRPMFERVHAEYDDNNVVQLNILGSGGGDDGLFTTHAAQKKKKSATTTDNDDTITVTKKKSVTVVGAGSIDDVMNGGGIVMTRTAPKEKRKLSDDDNNSDDDSMDNGDDDGLTFAERIAALHNNNNNNNTINDNQQATAASKSKKKVQQDTPQGPLKADSLSILLSQALQSNDKLLLERCFTVRNNDIIKKTVSRIRPTEAASLLRCLVQRLQSSPARGEQLTVWIRMVLIYHTAYLSSVSSTSGLLTYLYQIIESRLSSYQPLLSLNGRLDLVLANATRKDDVYNDDGDGDVNGGDGPLLTVGVDDDGGVEVEDAFAGVAIDDDDDGSDDDDDDGSDSDGSDDYMDEDED